MQRLFGNVGRNHQSQTEADLEMEPVDRNDSSWRRRLIPTPSNPEIKARQEECQELLQDGRPTFLPTFSSLRAICLERTRDQLRTLNTQIESAEPGPHRNSLIDQATELLKDLDRQFNAITERHELEDPEYAAKRGLSLTHFIVEDGRNRGEWMLLTSDWGIKSRSIIESDPSKLTSFRREWLKAFCGGAEPRIIAFKRRKTLVERQRGAVRENGKIIVPNPSMKIVWSVILAAGILALVVFLGVGIIATTTTFSPIFVQYFFWIAIAWILISGALLVVVVRAFGANGKDSFSAFLAAVAIWLVVIQIGQTKLNGQLQRQNLALMVGS